jgi:oxygen-dependent protoporphyrinogen oxidase
VQYVYLYTYLFTQVTDYLVDPLCRGVFASSPKSLSLRSCFPIFHEYESKYGSIVMGMFRDSEGVVQSCDARWIVGKDSLVKGGMWGGAITLPP